MKFLEAYHKLKEMEDWKFSISFYYHDEDSEPMLIIESDVERITLDHSDDCGFIISIFTKENLISFTQNNWLAFTGGEYITFGSANENGIHWIIEFC